MPKSKSSSKRGSRSQEIADELLLWDDGKQCYYRLELSPNAANPEKIIDSLGEDIATMISSDYGATSELLTSGKIAVYLTGNFSKRRLSGKALAELLLEIETPCCDQCGELIIAEPLKVEEHDYERIKGEFPLFFCGDDCLKHYLEFLSTEKRLHQYNGRDWY